jgi:hypothetical protein
MIRTTVVLPLLLAAATTFAAAQTQMPNSVKIGNEGITITSIPPTAKVQFGTSSAPGIWAAPVSLPANALPELASYSLGVTPATLLLAPQGDPDPNVLKELDAQEGPVAYTGGYTDATGAAQVLHVPAMPGAPSPLIPPTPGTVYPLVISNVQPVSGSPAVPVLSLFAVKPYVLVGGVLSNFTWNITINGTLLNCDFGQLGADGSTTMSCIVPSPGS